MRSQPATNGRTAQDRLVREILVVHPEDTIEHIEQHLLRDADHLETINYGYVTDKKNRLIGVFSIKELFRQAKNARVSDIMKRGPVVAFPGTKQNHLALIALNHRIKGVPVVDRDHHLLGVVPSDVILEILHEEQTQQLLRIAGIRIHPGSKQLLETSAWIAFRRRIPWLLIGLLGGIGAASIVDAFEITLKQHALLVAFIPAIVYMASAVGTQSQTILIRAMATINNFNFYKQILREVQTSFLIASTIALSVATAVTLFWKEPTIAIVMGIAFFLVIFLETGISLFLPWIFNKLKMDPAVSTGPFATILSDIMTLVIYFSIATIVIRTIGLS